jgi:phosphatidylglycerol:prolipoprotein diacylglycerol transferase
MHPVLTKLGPFTIHSYGFLIAIGFLIAVATVRRLAAASRLDVDRVLDLTFWSLLVGLIGARLVFVLTLLDGFLADPLAVFRVWEGGLVFYGGPLAVVPFVIWYVRRHPLPFWRTGDAMIPGLVVAHMFGRFGCLAAGCCYGKPTGSSWGIHLPNELIEPKYHGLALHPVQLYEAGALGVLFLGLLWVHRHRRFDGQVVLTYFMTYPIIRSITEAFRGDLIRQVFFDGWLSTSQIISIFVFIGAFLALRYRLRQVEGVDGADRQAAPA